MYSCFFKWNSTECLLLRYMYVAEKWDDISTVIHKRTKVWLCLQILMCFHQCNDCSCCPCMGIPRVIKIRWLWDCVMSITGSCTCKMAYWDRPQVRSPEYSMPIGTLPADAPFVTHRRRLCFTEELVQGKFALYRKCAFELCGCSWELRWYFNCNSQTCQSTVVFADTDVGSSIQRLQLCSCFGCVSGIFETGGYCLHIKTPSRHRDFPCDKDKMVVWSCYVYHRDLILVTCYWYWDRAQVLRPKYSMPTGTMPADVPCVIEEFVQCKFALYM